MCGSVIDSDVPLAEAMPCVADVCDIEIRIASLPEKPPGIGPNWSLEGSRLWLEIPDIARLRISEGRWIEINPAPGLQLENWAPFITGPALGILLHQCGDLVLHAAAVEIDGRAIVLSGLAGSGKSVLAAAFAKRGHSVLGDDLCRISFDPVKGPLAQPEGPYVKLWPRVAERMGYRHGERIRPPIGKSRFLCRAPDGPLPVVALFEMQRAARREITTIEAVTGIDAIGSLSRLSYCPWLIDVLPNGASRQFRNAAALLRQVPLCLPSYFNDWDLLDGTVARIESYIRRGLP